MRRRNTWWSFALALACAVPPLSGGCGAIDKAITRSMYQSAARRGGMPVGTFTVERVINREPPYVLDEKSMQFAGDAAAAGGRVRAKYQEGLEGHAKTLCDFIEQVLSGTEPEIGLRIWMGIKLYLLNVEKPPRSLRARLTMQGLEIPFPVFISKADAARPPVTEEFLEDLSGLVHELVEMTLSWPAAADRPRALADIELAGGLYRARNYTRWFRDGFANYAGNIALRVARQTDQWPTDLPVTILGGHTRPFSALAERGRTIFHWHQFARGEQFRMYEAATGLFLLIEARYGRDAIRRIVAAASNLGYADGPALINTCNHVLAADVRELGGGFRFLDLGLELTGYEDNLGDGPSSRRWAVLVAGVAPRGMATRGGTRNRDVILAVGGRRVYSPLDLELAVFNHLGAETLEVVVERGPRQEKTIILPIRAAGAGARQ